MKEFFVLTMQTIDYCEGSLTSLTTLVYSFYTKGEVLC